MSERPGPGDKDFWAYARGDRHFAEWIRRVDDLCMRFLDQDLLSLPMIDTEQGLDLRDCYYHEVSPGGYMAELLAHLKAESGEALIDTHVARQLKWGTVPYEIRDREEGGK